MRFVKDLGILDWIFFDFILFVPIFIRILGSAGRNRGLCTEVGRLEPGPHDADDDNYDDKCNNDDDESDNDDDNDDGTSTSFTVVW